MDERHKIIQNLDPLEKLRIYMHYYIQSWSWNKEWGVQTKSFQDWIGDDNIQVRDHGPNWENFGFAQRYVTHEYGIYYWYWRFKDDNFTHHPVEIPQFKERQKPVTAHEPSDEECFPKLKGRKYTKYPFLRFPFETKNDESYKEAVRKFREEFRKGDEDIFALNAIYRIHREDSWQFGYYGRKIKLFFWRPYNKYAWYLRKYKRALIALVKKLAKTTEQQHVNKGKIPQELIGKSFTMYRTSDDEALKMIRRDGRKGDRVMMCQGVTYLIHRERFWWIKYYGIRIKRELMKISGAWAAKIKR